MEINQTAALGQQRANRGIFAVNLGLLANIGLAGVKTAIGILGHSPALLADGVNSVSDVAYYVAVSVFMRLSAKPADEEHPYGHNQLETIAALIVGSFVITTAIAIFWDSVNNVFDLLVGQGNFSGAAPAALVVALLTVGVKITLMLITRQIGQQTKNPVVFALAYDHRNDIITASAATAGIFLGRMGYPWVDPLAGALVALVILRTGIKIVSDSTSDLMDTIPGGELDDQIRSLVQKVYGVRQVEEIKAHRFGPYLVVNITVCVDGALSVAQGDKIATQVERTLLDHIEQMRRVHVHYHPA